MIARSAPLLAVVLGCLVTPAAANDGSSVPPLPELTELASPEGVVSTSHDPQALEQDGWYGEWQGEWAEDGTYRGTWSGTYSDPGPTATRVIDPDRVAASAYSAADRADWLNQCRELYYPGSSATGAVVTARPDVCQAYLEQYERGYAIAAQGTVPPFGDYLPGQATPRAYPQGGNAYPYAPVMWVRVPIIRQPAASTVTE